MKLDSDFKPNKDDDSLYVFFKIVHKDLIPPKAGYLEITSNHLNKTSIKHQIIGITELGVRDLLEKNIISE